MEKYDLVNLDDDGSITVELDDYHEAAGEVRTTKMIAGNRQQKHGYSVKYSVLMQCPGFWETDPDSSSGSNGETDTTLAVIKVEPVIARHNDWFRTLSVKLEVTDDRDSSGNIVERPGLYDKPYIQSYAPAQHSPTAAATARQPTEKVNTQNGSLQGGPPGGFLSVSLGGSHQKKVSYESLKFLKVSSDTCPSEDNSSDNAAVRWAVTAIDESLGTGNSITVALLVRRSPGCAFSILADTEGHLGLVGRTVDWLKKKKIIFIPGLGTADRMADQYSTTAAAVTIERNNMRALTQPLGNGTALDILVGGSGIHLMQEVEPVLGQAENPPAPPANSASGPTDYVGGASGQQLWDARARRHRNMAILYENLAKLHREEAGEAQALADVPFKQYLDGLLE